MSGSVPLKTKDELREYLASAELQEVLRQTLSTILKRDDLPSATALVRVLGEELVSISEEAAAADEEDAEADEEEQRRIMAMRGKRRTGVSAESTSTMQTQEKPTVEGTEKTSEQKVRIEKAIDGNLLFEGIGGAQKEQLFQLMFEKTLEAGVNVITQGEEGDNFYVLDSGTCDIFVDGKEVASATDGDSFGELALMYSAPRAATVTTTSQVSLWAMDRITFRSMLFEKANAKREQYKEFLSSVKLLEPMEAYEREKIADVLETVEFADGEAVISEGEEGDTFFIVVEGVFAC
jgi:cAMP-dependent protein kinase regulator